MPRPNVFISYSHQDQLILRSLLPYLESLQRQKLAEIWSDTDLKGGDRWREEIEAALNSATVAVLLISQSFLNSSFIYEEELPRIFRRQSAGKLTVLPVYLSPSTVTSASISFIDNGGIKRDVLLSDFQGFGTPDRTIKELPPTQRDRRFLKLHDRIKELAASALPTPPASAVRPVSAIRAQPLGGGDGPEASPKAAIGAPSANSTSDTSRNAGSSLPSGVVLDRPEPERQELELLRDKVRQDSYYDVCIICALPEEGDEVINVFSDKFGVKFESRFTRRNREFKHAIITNSSKEKLKLHVSWPAGYGPEETSLHAGAVLDEFRPRFAGMTGICAGDRRKVHLGDLVVAKKAFKYDSGKMVIAADGQREHLPDTDTKGPDQDTLQFITNFHTWKTVAAELKRPVSKRQQRDWLLDKLLQESTPRVDDLNEGELDRIAPSWRRIMRELQDGEKPVLTRDRALRDKTEIRERRFREMFPFVDPLQPKCYAAAMASGSMVRSDDPFKLVQQPVRTALAIDMEGYAFYRAVADFPGIRSLVVKAVCDYADPDKDDSYHQYASKLSAIYLAHFISTYVNADRIPRTDVLIVPGSSDTPAIPATRKRPSEFWAKHFPALAKRLIESRLAHSDIRWTGVIHDPLRLAKDWTSVSSANLKIIVDIALDASPRHPKREDLPLIFGRWHQINSRVFQFITLGGEDSGVSLNAPEEPIGFTCVLPVTQEAYERYRCGRLSEWEFGEYIIPDHVITPAKHICIQSITLRQRFWWEYCKRKAPLSALLHTLVRHVAAFNPVPKHVRPVLFADANRRGKHILENHGWLLAASSTADRRPLYELVFEGRNEYPELRTRYVIEELDRLLTIIGVLDGLRERLEHRRREICWAYVSGSTFRAYNLASASICCTIIGQVAPSDATSATQDLESRLYRPISIEILTPRALAHRFRSDHEFRQSATDSENLFLFGSSKQFQETISQLIGS
jgi:nucleoside phosphorylase